MPAAVRPSAIVAVPKNEAGRDAEDDVANNNASLAALEVGLARVFSRSHEEIPQAR